MHPKRSVLICALGLAGALVGVDFSFNEASVASSTAGTGLPLRVEFSLAERAHAATVTAAPQARATTAGPVRLRMALDLRTVPTTERTAASGDGASPTANGPTANGLTTNGLTTNGPTTNGPTANGPTANGPVRLDLLARARELGDMSNTFAAASWVAPPPPPPPPPPPSNEPPRAPPLPYRFMGSLDDGAGGNTFFLIRGTETINASVGQTLDSTYLVERAENGMLHFLFLPLRQTQTLPIGPGL